MNVNTLNTAATTTGSGASNGSKKAAEDATAAADRFLKLLVTQMQNQDPLNPMDNAQVTSQMAQINTVNGIEKLNTTVQGLSGQFVQMQALQSVGLVGHDVIVAGNRVDVVDGVGQGGFQLDGPADKVTVEVLSSSGAVIDTVQLGAQGSGMGSFNWAAGDHAKDSGLTFRVSARIGAAPVPSTALMRDRVDAVSSAGQTLTLQLQNSGSVAYGDVKAFN
jgi:flagellar basal-body rod modification protein FlgD